MPAQARIVPIMRPLDFPHAGALTEAAVQAMLRHFYHAPYEVLADGALDPTLQARYFITKGSAWAGTLAAPSKIDDDNTEIEILSTTAFAHVLTATGLLKTGSASASKATFAASAGASLKLVAYGGFWYVNGGGLGITFS